MIARYFYLAWLQQRLRRYLADARRVRDFQHRALLRKVRRNAASDFGRDFGFGSIRTLADFRRQVPILTYQEHQPYIARVLAGDVGALFGPGTEVLMFATTSGTTGEPKQLPITIELFREYKWGWRMWGGAVFGDHRDLLRKKMLHLTSDWRQSPTPGGVPCGQISGLAASTRPLVSRPIFLPPAPVTRIHDYAAKHYTTLRLALASERGGMIVTANPSTLVEFAHRA
ncbi:MAG: GH3 auxin-responsive promoter family protein, partial [Pirellulales bacterium]